LQVAPRRLYFKYISSYPNLDLWLYSGEKALSCFPEVKIMRKVVIYAAAIIGAAALAAPVFAGPVGVPRVNVYQQRSTVYQPASIVNELQTQKYQLSREADLENARGPLRLAYMDKQDEIDRVISNLRDGRPVPVYAINDALEPVTD
jgi:hypothetical protein